MLVVIWNYWLVLGNELKTVSWKKCVLRKAFKAFKEWSADAQVLHASFTISGSEYSTPALDCLQVISGAFTAASKYLPEVMAVGFVSERLRLHDEEGQAVAHQARCHYHVTQQLANHEAPVCHVKGCRKCGRRV